MRAIFQSKTLSSLSCIREVSGRATERSRRNNAHLDIDPLLLRQHLVLIHEDSFSHDERCLDLKSKRELKVDRVR